MQSHNQQIKEKGLKATPARIAVLKTLEKTKKPIDIKELTQLLKVSNITVDQATIYRIIENFSKTGLVNKLQLQEKKFYYEGIREDHHHAICLNCEEIIDISGCSLSSLENDIKTMHNFKIEKHSLEFFGLCKKCKA